MKIDSTLTLAIIVTVISFVSPIVVSLINNHHLKVMRKLDLQQENLKLVTIHKRELFENYLKIVGEFSYEDTKEQLSSLTTAYYLILPHIPSDKVTYFKDFSEKLSLLYDETIVKTSSDEDYLKRLLHDEIIPTIKKELYR